MKGKVNTKVYTENMTNASLRTRMGNNDTLGCGCDVEASVDVCDGACRSSWGLDGYPVGMVYAPIQRFDRILDLDTAMHKGTIFEELDLPFKCGMHTKGGCCNG